MLFSKDYDHTNQLLPILDSFPRSSYILRGPIPYICLFASSSIVSLLICHLTVVSSLFVGHATVSFVHLVPKSVCHHSIYNNEFTTQTKSRNNSIAPNAIEFLPNDPNLLPPPRYAVTHCRPPIPTPWTCPSTTRHYPWSSNYRQRNWPTRRGSACAWHYVGSSWKTTKSDDTNSTTQNGAMAWGPIAWPPTRPCWN